MHRLAPLILLPSVLALLEGCDFGQAAPALATRASAPPQRGLKIPTEARGNLRFFVGYAAGQAEAERTGRPMLIYFTADWGDYCRQLERETFTQREIVLLARKFVLTLVDADAEPALCRSHDVTGYPTLELSTPDGRSLARIEGKQPTEVVLTQLRAALGSAGVR